MHFHFGAGLFNPAELPCDWEAFFRTALGFSVVFPIAKCALSLRLMSFVLERQSSTRVQGQRLLPPALRAVDREFLGLSSLGAFFVESLFVVELLFRSTLGFVFRRLSLEDAPFPYVLCCPLVSQRSLQTASADRRFFRRGYRNSPLFTPPTTSTGVQAPLRRQFVHLSAVSPLFPSSVGFSLALFLFEGPGSFEPTFLVSWYPRSFCFLLKPSPPPLALMRFFNLPPLRVCDRRRHLS